MTFSALFCRPKIIMFRSQRRSFVRTMTNTEAEAASREIENPLSSCSRADPKTDKSLSSLGAAKTQEKERGDHIERMREQEVESHDC